MTLLRILWPAFLAAGLTSAIVFALVDPLDVYVFGYLQADRQLVYAVGFFLFWATAAFSSALSVRLMPGAGAADRGEEEA